MQSASSTRPTGSFRTRTSSSTSASRTVRTSSTSRRSSIFRTYLRLRPYATNRKVVEQLIDELEAVVATQKKANDRPPGNVDRPPPPIGPARTSARCRTSLVRGQDRRGLARRRSGRQGGRHRLPHPRQQPRR